MTSTYALRERSRQDAEHAMSEAIDLRLEGLTYAQIGARLKLGKDSVEKMIKRSPRMICACGEKLVLPVPEDMCGWCLELAAAELEAVPA